MPVVPIARTFPHVVSKEQQFAVSSCPKCGSRNIRGPFDTQLTATFLFTRAWCCLDCWWDREIQVRHDVEEAAYKHAKREARNKKLREQRQGARA